MTTVAEKARQIPTPPGVRPWSPTNASTASSVAAAFRLFSRCGFDEGMAGHIRARDPQHTNSFWSIRSPALQPDQGLRPGASDGAGRDHRRRPAGQRRRVRHPRRRARGASRRDRGGPRPLHLRQVVVSARPSARPADAGRVRLLRRPRPVRRLHRRRRRPARRQASGRLAGRAQGGHPAQPRTAHRGPHRRRGGMVVRHDGADLSVTAAVRGQQVHLDRRRNGGAHPEAVGGHFAGWLNFNRSTTASCGKPDLLD